MYIFLVTLLGIILRLFNIIKPEGMWNDEYVSWFIANTSVNNGFWHEVLKQCHMPLYYFYLKPFCCFNDTILRLTSLVPGVLAIPIMYLAGKEYSEKCGKYAAIITSTLPFLIYYSQEIRFYSLLFLFSAITLLFLIKYIKNPVKINLILYFASTLLVLLTHVLGIVFVFFCTIYLLYKKRALNKSALISIILSFLIVIPIGINILNQRPSAQWWGIFSYTNILFLFSDFFSPILTNNINAPTVFFYNKSLLFNILLVIPTLFSITGLILGSRKAKGLMVIASCVMISLVALAKFGIIVFISKYLIEILPILILTISLGFSDMKYKTLGLVCFVIFMFSNLFAIFTPFYSTKSIRSEGNNLPAVILNNISPDKVIYTYYAPDRFQRYLKINPPSAHISKINRFEYLDTPQKIFTGINKGEKASIVFLDSVSFIPHEYLEEAISKNIPEMFITFSAIRYSLEKSFYYYFDNISVSTLGSWTVITGVKKHK